MDRPLFPAAAVVAILCGLLPTAPVRAQEAESDAIDGGIAWTQGPAKVDIGRSAAIDLPEGYLFAGPKDTKTILERMGNIADGSHLGLVTREDSDWFVIFRFDDSGYVKDDEELDPDDLLASLRESQAEANKERKRRGLDTLEILGWAVPPGYNPETHNLEWATNAKADDGNLTVNHNTRILGRHGVMSASLVLPPESLDATLPVYRQLMTGYAYDQGSRYTEFTQGDKVAKIGLAALVVGGAAAAATKFGFFAKFWKVIVGAAIVVAAFAKKIVGSLFGRKGEPTGGPTAAA